MSPAKGTTDTRAARAIQRKLGLTNKQLVFAREIAKGNNQNKLQLLRVIRSIVQKLPDQKMLGKVR